MGCEHNIRAKLIEIPGKEGKEFGNIEYEMDYSKLEKIAHRMTTGEGFNYCFMEYLYCCECGLILEENEVFTG